MSVYNRKGGAGKSGTLREQFNYYKRQLENRLIAEQAFKEARGQGTLESRVYTLFKNTDFKKVYTYGVTRKVGSRTIRYVGTEAVKIQIESMRRRASKSYQADLFINNYIASMEGAGFSDEIIDYVEKQLNKLSVDRLTLLVDKGILPSIQFVYTLSDDEDDFVRRFDDAIQRGATREEIANVKRKQKELVRVIKEKSKILNW